MTNKLAVFDLHAVVLDNIQSSCFRHSCRLVISYPELHPNRFHVVTSQRLFDDLRNLFVRPEDFNDIDGVWNIGQCIGGLFPEYLVRRRIDRANFVAMALKVAGTMCAAFS
ncbi:hypothetical protein HAPAU_39990 [Halalkalicoccus paucihalophilus]|uniref:Uncharacterized protein n=1 Tax=Halalkalicoccus paucihalophilus TaxID=1008153 RepID=A0A151A8N7_9EURY|nr:hypothetical protein HAPAU_39990 [Halalkalicoccus paucihalophilus]